MTNYLRDMTRTTLHKLGLHYQDEASHLRLSGDHEEAAKAQHEADRCFRRVLEMARGQVLEEMER